MNDWRRWIGLPALGLGLLVSCGADTREGGPGSGVQPAGAPGRAAGAGAVTIEVAFEGLLPALDEAHPDRVALRDAAGQGRAVYRDLSAIDADGRELGARFAVSGNSVRLVIDDEGARYPVLVDPLIA